MNAKKVNMISLGLMLALTIFTGIANATFLKNIYLEDIEIQKTSKTPIGKIKKHNRKKITTKHYEKQSIYGHDSVMQKRSFHEIDGWEEDYMYYALEAFLQSCAVFARKKPEEIVKTNSFIFGSVGNWQQVCQIALSYKEKQDKHLFFEENFTPYLVISRKSKTSKGKFTGYHEPAYLGSAVKTQEFRFPIISKPSYCTSTSSCPTRAQINKLKFDPKYTIAWLKNPIDVWNLQLQGSGMIVFTDRTVIRVKYGGFNNHKSTNFWRTDTTKSMIPPGMSSTKWLDAHPDKAEKAVNQDKSYVFLDRNVKKYAVGSSTANLIPGRSLAVDRKVIPYGMPVWIETKVPLIDHQQEGKWLEFRRVAVAQDTGSAIIGFNRADIFFGHGEKAEIITKNLSFDGHMLLLVPNNITPQPRTN